MDANIPGQRVLVLGAGATGISMARWLARHGARVRVADSRSEPPGAAQLARELPGVELHAGPFREDSLEGIDCIAISPGVPLATPLVAQAQAQACPVVGDVELFARNLGLGRVAAPPRVLAITGSNGKSTVTTMTGAICQRAGLKTVVAGNIGLPVLDALALQEAGNVPDLYVLELSSFQLETTSSLRPVAATVLNLSEDHLDRYPGMAEYAAAKERIFEGDGIQVLNREDALSMAMARPGRRVASFGLDAPALDDDWGLAERDGAAWLARGAHALMPASELQVAGMHNAANALAALALGRAAGCADEPMRAALRDFRGLRHRVELVAEIGGVRYYDDSKGTNVGATVAAVQGMREPVVLIAGGDGKGQDFAPLRAPVAGRARAVMLIGRDAPRVEAALADCGVPLARCASLEEAVVRAQGAALPGDAVLLSPACASLDMFRNYEHRAEVFVAAVRALEKGARQ